MKKDYGDLRKDHEFFVMNAKEMQDKYGGKFIAIKNQRVIAVGRGWLDLEEKIKKKDRDALRTYVPEKGKKILW